MQPSPATDLDGLAVRCGAGHGGLDAAAVVDLLAADHDGRVPDAIELRVMQAVFAIVHKEEGCRQPLGRVLCSSAVQQDSLRA